MPNDKRKKKGPSRKNIGRKFQSHRIDFSHIEQEECRTWLKDRELQPESIILDIVDRLYQYKIRYSEHYDNYSFSITCPEEHETYPKANFWFTFGDFTNGILVSAFIVSEWLELGRIDLPENTGSGDWL